MTDCASNLCIICFETFSPNDISGRSSKSFSSEGISCSNNHFICNLDFVQYCNENVFPELKLFVDRNGRIPCPIKECDGCFDEVVAMNRFNPHSRIRYCNLIEEKLVPLYPSIKLLSNSLRDLLTLSCPHCHLAVDPYPDACSAVLCLNCSSYYCNACFALFRSEDNNNNNNNSTLDRANAHEHVASHKIIQNEELESRDAFLSSSIVKQCQQEYQQHKIIQFITLAFTSKDNKQCYDQMIRYCMILCYEDILLLEIDPLDCWWKACHKNSGNADDLTALPVPPPPLSTQSDHNNDVHLLLDELVGITEGVETGNNSVEEGGAKEVSIQNGQILANAMLSHNLVAIEQIFQSYRHQLSLSHSNSNSNSNIVAEVTLQVNFKAKVPVDNSEYPYIEYPLLSLAILLGFEEIAIKLIQFGADLYNLDNQTLHSSLYIIIEKGALKVFDFVLNHVPHLDLNANLSSPATKYSALLVAARYNQYKFIDKIIAHGGDVNQQEEEICYTPLALALVMDGLRVARRLLTTYSPNLFALSKEGKTAVGIAVERGHLEILQLILLQYSEVMNMIISPKDGRTILHIAIVFHQNHIIYWLLSELKTQYQQELSGGPTTMTKKRQQEKLDWNQLDVPVNDADNEEEDGKLPEEDEETPYSPLMLAIHYANPNAAILLLQTAQEIEETLYLNHAAKSTPTVDPVPQIPLLNLMHSHVQGKLPLYLAIERGYLEVVNALLAYSPRLLLQSECVTNDYYPIITRYKPFHIAIEFEKLAILSCLMKHYTTHCALYHINSHHLNEEEQQQQQQYWWDCVKEEDNPFFHSIAISLEEEVVIDTETGTNGLVSMEVNPAGLAIVRNKIVCLQVLLQAMQTEYQRIQTHKNTLQHPETPLFTIPQIVAYETLWLKHIQQSFVLLVMFDRVDALVVWLTVYGPETVGRLVFSALPSQPVEYTGSVLHYLVAGGHTTMLEILLDHLIGDDTGKEMLVTCIDSNGQNVLDFARGLLLFHAAEGGEDDEMAVAVQEMVCCLEKILTVSVSVAISTDSDDDDDDHDEEEEVTYSQSPDQQQEEIEEEPIAIPTPIPMASEEPAKSEESIPIPIAIECVESVEPVVIDIIL